MAKAKQTDTNKPAKRKRPGAGNHSPIATTIDTSKINPELLKAIISDCSNQLKATIVKTDEECLERLADFFEYYSENGGLPTIEKMCLWLGADRTTVFEWARGTKGSARANIIKRAKDVMSAIDADLALRGLIRDAVYIFRGKNYYGMKDQQDVVVQAKNIFGADVDRKEIERRLTEEVVIEDTTEKPATIPDTDTE